MADPNNLKVGGDATVAFPIIIGYNFLQIFGFLSCAIVVLTAALSRRIARSANWYSFMILWIFWCIQHFILVGHQTGPEPPRGLCLLQGAFLYSAPPANAFATLCLLLSMYFSVSKSIRQRSGASRVQNELLLYVPILVYVVVFVSVLTIGLEHPGQVARSKFGTYCNIQLALPSYLAAALVILPSVLMLIFEGLMFMLIREHWARIKQMNAGQRAIPLTLVLRVSIFAFVPMLSVILSASAMSSNSSYNSPAAILVTASLPGLAGLIFGTQKDMIAAWTFWKPRRYEVDVVPSTQRMELKQQSTNV